MRTTARPRAHPRLLAFAFVGLALSLIASDRWSPGDERALRAQGDPAGHYRLSQVSAGSAAPATTIGQATGIETIADGRLAVLAAKIARDPRLVFFEADGSVSDLWHLTGLDRDQVRDLESAPEGGILVGTRGALELWRDGQRAERWPLPDFVNEGGRALPRQAYRIRRGPQGQIFVSAGSGAASVILRYAGDGRLLGTIGEGGTEDHALNTPAGMDFDEAGRFYVADSSNHRIQVYDDQGQWQESWGSRGVDPGQFNNPVDIRRIEDGFLVVDRGNRRLQWLAEDGSPRSVLGGPEIAFNGPWELVIADDDTLWVLDAGNHRVLQLSAAGQMLGSMGGPDAGVDVWAAAVAEDGSVVQVDAAGLRVLHRSPRGELIDTWGSEGAEPDQFSTPRSAAHIEPSMDGGWLIAGMQAGLVQRFDAGGTFLGAFDGTGDSLPPLGDVRALRTAADGIWTIAGQAPFVRRYAPDGRPSAGFAQEGSQPGSLTRPESLALIDPDRVLVADLISWQYFDRDGQVLEALRHDWPSICDLPAGVQSHPAAHDFEQLRDGRLIELDGHAVHEWDLQGRRGPTLRSDLDRSGPGYGWAALGPSGKLLLGDRSGRIETLEPEMEAGDESWLAAWHDDPWLTGWPSRTELLERGDAEELLVSWPAGAAPEGTRDDAWSARFTRALTLEQGRVMDLRLSAAGGLRLEIDGRLLVDAWHQDGVDWRDAIELSAGAHVLTIELRDRGGPASLRFDFEPLGLPTSSPSPSPSPRPSPTETARPTTPATIATARPRSTPWSQRFPERLYLPLLRSWSERTRPEPSAAWLSDASIDVQLYDLYLRVPEMGGTIEARVGIELHSLGQLDALRLDLEPASIAVEQVTLDGDPARFKIESGRHNDYGLTGSKLVVELELPSQPGQRHRLDIDYRILASSLSGDKGFMYTADFQRIPVLITRNFPYYTRFFLPSHDHPADPARFEIEMRVPSDMVAASNGELVSGSYAEGEGLDAEGLRRFRWRQETAIATYGLNIGVGPFMVRSGTLCYDPDAEDTRVLDCAADQAGATIPWVTYHLSDFNAVDLALLQRATVHHAQRFGDYPFAKLGVMAAPHPYSNASPSLITLVARHHLAHEIAHAWWGNGVRLYGLGWGEGWLSEGLANYSDVLYREAVEREAASADCSCRDGGLLQPADLDPWDLYGGPERSGALYCGGLAAFHDLRWRFAQHLGLPIWREQPRRVLTRLLASYFEDEVHRASGSRRLLEVFKRELPDAMAGEGGSIDPESARRLIDDWSADWIE